MYRQDSCQFELSDKVDYTKLIFYIGKYFSRGWGINPIAKRL